MREVWLSVANWMASARTITCCTEKSELAIIKWGRFDYQWQIGWRVLAHLLAAAIIKWGIYDYQWQIGWWVRAHLLPAQTERKSERQWLNEGDLIISGKLDGGLERTLTCCRDRKKIEQLSNEGNLIINFTQNWLITTNIQIKHSMFWNWNN